MAFPANDAQAEQLASLREQNARQHQIIQALNNQLEELSKRFASSQSPASSSSGVSLPVSLKGKERSGGASVGEFRFPKSAKNPTECSENSTNAVQTSVSGTTLRSVCIEKWFHATDASSNVVHSLCEMWTDFLGPSRLILSSPTIGSLTFTVRLLTNSLSFVPSHVQARFFFKPLPTSPKATPLPLVESQATVGPFENRTDRVLQSLLEDPEDDEETSEDGSGTTQQSSKARSEETITRKEMYDLPNDSDNAFERSRANPFWSVVELPLIRDSDNPHQFNGILTVPSNSIPQFTAVLRLF